MPYLSPTSSTANSTSDNTSNSTNSSEPTETATRFSHRRTRSATPTFSNEVGPGAFTPLVGVPRRQRQYEKKMFQIAPDDDEEPEAASQSPPVLTTPKSTPPTVERPEPKIIISSSSQLPPNVSHIPFPTSSGSATAESSLPFPSLDPQSKEPPRASRSSSISRSGSTPIVLANGKPLKPSLKSSVSSPQIADWRAQHPRSRSEPSTPVAPKTVHFPERKDELEGVVVFEKMARPRAVSGHVEDTETETEGYDSPGSAGLFGGSSRSSKDENQFSLDVDTDQSSTIPVKDPSAFSNVYVETLVFPRTRPPTLRGSILVKNVAFEKSVALRFTLDNWQTTSEVVCRHVCTLPTLPSPFPPERPTPGVPTLAWDRFSFLVRLEDVERKLAERTIYFAARYQAAGVGEWWDNNNGSNYKLVFKKVPQTNSSATPNAVPKGPSPLRQSEGPNPNKMFPGLDLRPATLSLDSADSTLPPLKLKRPFSPGLAGSVGRSSPPPKSAPVAPVTSTSTVTVAPPGPTGVTTTSSAAHQRNASNSSIASSGSSGSLRLSNYASPTSPVPNWGAIEGLPANGQRSSISMFLNDANMAMINGMPSSLPPSPEGSRLSPNTSMLNVPSRDGRSSPLVQRRSPTNSILSSISPASTAPPVTPASPFPATSSDVPSPARSPSFETSHSATPPASTTPRKVPSPSSSVYPFPTGNGQPANGFPTNDSKYAALIEKWCFHQSPPPNGTGTSGSPSSEASTPGLSAGATANGGPFSAFDAGASGYGNGYGYGPLYTGKPVSLKP